MSDDNPLLCAPMPVAHLPLEAQDRIRALRVENERLRVAMRDRAELLSQAFNALPDAEFGAHRLYEDLRRAWAGGGASYSGWRRAVAAIGVR